MSKKCDICGCNRVHTYCLECGWDFSEDAAKKQLYLKIVNRKKELLLQGKAAEKSKTDSEQQLREVEAKLSALPEQMEQLKKQKALIIHQLEQRAQQTQILKDLENKLSSFNYLLDVFSHNPNAQQEGRSVEIKSTDSNKTSFEVTANFKQKPSLLLVLSRKRFDSLATGKADYFLPLDPEMQPHGNKWRVKIPQILPKGKYWGFFTSFHAPQKCIVNPLQQYEINL